MPKLTCIALAIIFTLVAQGPLMAAPNGFQFSGYGQLVAGKLDTHEAEFADYSGDWRFDAESLLGMQLEYQFNRHWSVATQLRLHANHHKESGIDWAYVSYIDDGLEIRAGKLHLPFLLYSQVRNLGVAYPWLRPPEQVYDAYTFPTFEGIQGDYSWRWNNIDIQLGGLLGDVDYDYRLVDIVSPATVDNMWGAYASAFFQGWQVRSALIKGEIALELDFIDELVTLFEVSGFPRVADTLRPQGDSRFLTFGLDKQSLHYFVTAESIHVRIDSDVFPKLDAYYVSAGLYRGKWTPYITLATSRNRYGPMRFAIPFGVSQQQDIFAAIQRQAFDEKFVDDLDSLTLGVKYDISATMSVKGEFNWLKGDEQERSFFRNIQAGFDRRANRFSLGVFWIF